MSKTEKREREQWVRHWTSEAKIEEIEGQNLNLVPADLTKLKEDPKIQWDQSLLLINQKKDSTGIGYEPWHIRYVGIPHARIIDQKNWTLEEYYAYLEVGKYYQYENYLITSQPQDSIEIPQNYEKIVISPDNQGNYLLTIQGTRSKTNL